MSNKKLTSFALALTTALSLSAVALDASADNSIVGSWNLTGQTETNAIITFLADGTYFHAEDSTPDSSGTNGMERGTYSWSQLNGDLTSVTLIDTNGEWGMSHPVGSRTLSFVNYNTINIADDQGIDTLTRVSSSTNALVGSWNLTGQTETNAIITFLADGTYFHAEDSTPDSSGTNGMERGTYSWSQLNGDLTSVTLIDTNGEWGMSHPVGSRTLSFVNYNTINIADDQGIGTGTRVTPVPEPETYGMMLLGLGLMGFVARRRKNEEV